MSFEIGETLIDYQLLKILKKAEAAGVYKDIAVKGENENRYVSELAARMTALDPKSVFIALVMFVENHPETVVKTLDYLDEQYKKNNKEEGEETNE